MKWKAICFDIDGTLYPISEMNKRLLSVFFKHPISCARYDKGRIAYRKKQGTMNIEDLYKQEAVFSFGNKKKGEKDIERRKGEFIKNVYTPMEKAFNTIKPYEGVIDTLYKLSQHKIKIGILSDFPLFHKLDVLKIASFCDFSISSCDTGYLKPDKRAFIPLIKGLGLKNNDILYVGDSSNKDAKGAVNAGMDVVLVNRDKKNTNPNGALEIFKTWTDFSNWIDSILLEV